MDRNKSSEVQERAVLLGMFFTLSFQNNERAASKTILLFDNLCNTRTHVIQDKIIKRNFLCTNNLYLIKFKISL